MYINGKKKHFWQHPVNIALQFFHLICCCIYIYIVRLWACQREDLSSSSSSLSPKILFNTKTAAYYTFVYSFCCLSIENIFFFMILSRYYTASLPSSSHNQFIHSERSLYRIIITQIISLFFLCCVVCAF